MAPVKEIPCYLCGEKAMIGDDYNVHLTYAHGVEYDEDKILRNTRENRNEDGEHEGIVEPTFTINYENEVLDDTQIWKMFENIKSKVMNMCNSNSTEEEISPIETF